MRAALLLPLVAAAACTPPGARYEGLLPDDRLMIDEFDASMARGLGDPSDYYALTREITGEINGGVGEVLGLVDAITDFDPTWTDQTSTALWGPWQDEGGVYGRMWLTDTEAGYDWAIELQADATDDDGWSPVLVGHVDPGAEESHSKGWFAMDFDAIEAVGAGDGTTGGVACEYELLEDGASARLAFGDVSDDGSVPEDGAYRWEHTRGEGGLMDVAVAGDVTEPPNGTTELLIVRSRWNGEGAGRADATVTGGDLGALAYTESDCWDAGHTTTFFENNFELTSQGDPASCAFAEPSFNDAR